MHVQNNSLYLGGIASLLIALLHVILVIRPQIYRYFNAAELAQMHESGSPFTVIVTICLTVMFAIWGAYGFSGAGIFRQLPWLREALIAIGVIYVLRGLMLPSDIVKVIQSGYPVRFIGFSMMSLTAGLLYLHGVIVQF